MQLNSSEKNIDIQQFDFIYKMYLKMNNNKSENTQSRFNCITNLI